MTPPTYPLTTAGWIPVWDTETATSRDVGITEALTGAHHLALPATSEGIVLLRLLVAVYDAACGPRTTDEWDAAWHAPTLDTARITAYSSHWADRLDLLHPHRPAFQCGHLTAYPYGPEHLHPGRLGGDGGEWFNPSLRSGALPPWPPAQAARHLLYLLAYDVAGIKRAAPGDPAGKGNRVYGSQCAPLGTLTHLHLVPGGGLLKDVILLNLPPQPRTPGDAPVWERDTPPSPTRTRPPAGRLDYLTWPSRRTRLHATRDGLVDAVAHHDGDRLPTPGFPLMRQHDPMTAWTQPDTTSRAFPLPILDRLSWPMPWSAALLLDDSAGPQASSAAAAHAIAAAARGTLPPHLPVHAVAATTVHTNRHRAVIYGTPTATMPLGTAAQLADPRQRRTLAAMARLAGAITRSLTQAAAAISGRDRGTLAGRLTLSGLDRAWADAATAAATDPEDGRARWRRALHGAADRAIETVPLPRSQRAQLVSAYRTWPHTSRTPTAPEEAAAQEPDAPQEPAATPVPAAPARRRRGRPGTRYEAFGGTYTLGEIADLPQCVVSASTLARRAADRDTWPDIERAATTPAARGRRTTGPAPTEPGRTPDEAAPGESAEPEPAGGGEEGHQPDDRSP